MLKNQVMTNDLVIKESVVLYAKLETEKMNTMKKEEEEKNEIIIRIKKSVINQIRILTTQKKFLINGRRNNMIFTSEIYLMTVPKMN